MDIVDPRVEDYMRSLLARYDEPVLLEMEAEGKERGFPIIGRLVGGSGGALAPADQRMPGSVAAALLAAAQGVQLLRVHDVAATRQALAVWEAACGT